MEIPDSVNNLLCKLNYCDMIETEIFVQFGKKQGEMISCSAILCKEVYYAAIPNQHLRPRILQYGRQ